MDPATDADRLKRLLDDCLALEDQAGISAKMERAREGRFIPLGAFGEDASTDEYFADEHDHFRERARNAYFSVNDTALRIQLIEARRRVDEELNRSYESDVVLARRTEAAAEAKLKDMPWTMAAVVAVAAVGVGYWIFGLVGAIGGALGGFFLGQGVVHSARKEAHAAHRAATESVAAALDNKARSSLHPDCFSYLEETTGHREESFDRESAYGNVVGRAKRLA